MTEIEKEFVQWIIVRDALLASAFLCGVIFLLRLGRKIWNPADRCDGVLCYVAAAVLGFFIQQNIHGIIKASIAPNVFIRTYFSLLDGPIQKDLNGK